MKPATTRDGLFSKGCTARRTAAAAAADALACLHAAAAVIKSTGRDNAAARATAVLHEEPLLRSTTDIAVALRPLRSKYSSATRQMSELDHFMAVPNGSERTSTGL